MFLSLFSYYSFSSIPFRNNTKVNVGTNLEILSKKLTVESNFAEEFFKLLKLKMVDKLSALTTSILISIILAVVLFLFIIFGSFTLAYKLSETFNSLIGAFAVVSLFYLLLGVFFFASRNWLIKKNLIQVFLSSFFSDTTSFSGNEIGTVSDNKELKESLNKPKFRRNRYRKKPNK